MISMIMAINKTLLTRLLTRLHPALGSLWESSGAAEWIGRAGRCSRLRTGPGRQVNTDKEGRDPGHRYLSFNSFSPAPRLHFVRKGVGPGSIVCCSTVPADTVPAPHS